MVPLFTLLQVKSTLGMHISKHLLAFETDPSLLVCMLLVCVFLFSGLIFFVITISLLIFPFRTIGPASNPNVNKWVSLN